MHDLITTILEDSIRVKRQAVSTQTDTLIAAADMLATCLVSGHKILLFGNGGSAADAQHIAAEFVNRFQIERRPLAALALTTDTSVITSIGNDYAFDQIFAKQVQALGRRDDVAWGLSTSGNSPNVVAGLQAARDMGLRCLGMTGQGGALRQT
ncbi:MAG TPA: SIS domain-containing protein, partial [Desulfosarcina sp.]|nr:SIS domain-containing protein [Desulfosarcina sp.]